MVTVYFKKKFRELLSSRGIIKYVFDNDNYLPFCAEHFIIIPTLKIWVPWEKVIKLVRKGTLNPIFSINTARTPPHLIIHLKEGENIERLPSEAYEHTFTSNGLQINTYTESQEEMIFIPNSNIDVIFEEK
jgi:hypothetical protein